METREITLDARAQQRVIVLTHLAAGELTLDEAAAYLRLSTRQVRRLVDGFRTHGPAAVVHGNRGRAPANQTDEATPADLRRLLDDALGLALAADRSALGQDDLLAAAGRGGAITPSGPLAPESAGGARGLALHEAGPSRLPSGSGGRASSGGWGSGRGAARPSSPR